MQGFNLNIGPRSQFWLQIEDVWLYLSAMLRIVLKMWLWPQFKTLCDVFDRFWIWLTCVLCGVLWDRCEAAFVCFQEGWEGWWKGVAFAWMQEAPCGLSGLACPWRGSYGFLMVLFVCVGVALCFEFFKVWCFNLWVGVSLCHVMRFEFLSLDVLVCE